MPCMQYLKQLSGKGKKSKAGGGSGHHRDTCCTRLLWNTNGHWKDNWFTYEDGTLCGYREQGVKPPEVSIKMTTSKLTVYGADEFMRKLNLFKITTVCNVAHIFAAWSEEEYETWIDILSYVVGKKYEQVSFNIGTDRCIEEECYDNDIIPYDEGSLSRSHRKDHGKRLTDSRGESIDSGNDGDESGLESSVSSLFESRRRFEMERKEFGRTVSHSSIPEISHTPERTSFIRCSSEKDILSTAHQGRRINNNNNNNNNNNRIPTPQYPPFPLRETHPKNDKAPRPTSYPAAVDTIPDHRYQRTPSPSDHSSVVTSLKVPGDHPRKSTPAYSAPEGSVSQTPEYYVTPDNMRHHVRQCSTDTYLHLNDVAIDTTTSPTQTTDTTDNALAKLSVASYTDDVSSAHAHTIANEVRQKLEETLREETLLRRRRNSLNLELDLMKGKLEELKETSLTSISHQHLNNNNNNNNNSNIFSDNNNNKKRTCSLKDASTCEAVALERSKHIEILEKKAATIEHEIKTIDRRISVTVTDPTTLPGYGTTEKKRKSSIMKRLRATTKTKDPGSLVHTCSMSVESLTSTASHDSSVSRESPFLPFKHDPRSAIDVDRHQYLPSMSSVEERTDKSTPSEKNPSAVSSVKCSSPVHNGSPVYGSSPNGLNGIETLLRTTELLENGEFLTSNKRDSTSSSGDFSKRDSTSSESDPLLSGRSMSMSAVDKISKDRSGVIKTDTSALNSNSVDVIIEDFEKFSAMLMQTHQMKASGQIIDV